QSLLDSWTPHVAYRWVFTFVVFIAFMGRVFIYQGWYIITYALGIYYLNMLIAFLTPKIDPAVYDDFEGEGDHTFTTIIMRGRLCLPVLMKSLDHLLDVCQNSNFGIPQQKLH
ncbi:unnamed protein product, partial [Oppiella nova]